MTLFKTLRNVAAVLPVAICFRDNVFDIGTIVGPSMSPTLNPPGSRIEDRVLMFKLAGFFGFRGYERGDIVSLESPTTRGKRIIKRLIAIEGDWIINNDGQYVHIPKGHCWIEGDNVDISIDSNSFGAIPLAMIESRISCIIWPRDRAGMLDKTMQDRQRVRQRPYSY
mmetsp:Transcript_17313/g.21302  ORF Transcript_17313/g.21302 Transcript_17313/m.21302 type:complete len:168 (-) Transcript_17313:1061-1564(-)